MTTNKEITDDDRVIIVKKLKATAIVLAVFFGPSCWFII